MGCLVCFPGGMPVEINFRFGRCTDIPAGQQGKHGRAVHAAFRICVVDIVNGIPGILLMLRNWLIDICNNCTFPRIPMLMEEIYVQAGIFSPFQQLFRIITGGESF